MVNAMLQRGKLSFMTVIELVEALQLLDEWSDVLIVVQDRLVLGIPLSSTA